MHVPRGIAGGALRVALPGSRSGIPLLVRRGGYFQLNRRSDSSSPSSPAPRRWRATYSSAATSSPSSQNAVAASAAAPSESTLSSTPPNIPETVTINSKTHPTDAHFNISSAVLALTSRRLHLQKDHPVQITRQIIESVFPESVYSRYNEFDPVVSAAENFDSLGFPADHPGRSRTDTYYVNSSTLLRTHTSAHEAQLFRSNTSPGYLISADVYRRDEVDRSHYPVFHQMEGARVWDRSKVPGGDVAAAVRQDLERLGKHDMRVEDPNPPFHEERNPRQEKHHSAEEARLVGEHLKRSLELVVNEIFTRVKKAGAGAGGTEQNAGVDDDGEPLRVRWVEAYFPFTSPSWELEVWYQGEWLEVLGCGVSQQQILIDAGVPDQIGWAFGLGLERIAMLLFRIPDIRLFWSRDERFLGQFSGVSDDLGKLKAFVPFSKHPACYKDVSFWLADQTKEEWHENDLMEVVRDVCGDVVEDVKCTDKFTHPKTGRRSLCYRINYRSLERTLTNAETNEMHDKVTGELVKRLGVVIR